MKRGQNRLEGPTEQSHHHLLLLYIHFQVIMMLKMLDILQHRHRHHI
jgi:hypothetical protein